MDLLHGVEEAEGPTHLGQGDRDQSVLVGPDVVEGQVLELGPLDRFVGVDVHRRLAGVVERTGHRPVALVLTGEGGGQSADARVTPSPLLMKTGLSNRLRL